MNDNEISKEAEDGIYRAIMLTPTTIYDMILSRLAGILSQHQGCRPAQVRRDLETLIDCMGDYRKVRAKFCGESQEEQPAAPPRICEHDDCAVIFSEGSDCPLHKATGALAASIEVTNNLVGDGDALRAENCRLLEAHDMIKTQALELERQKAEETTRADALAMELAGLKAERKEMMDSQKPQAEEVPDAKL